MSTTKQEYQYSPSVNIIRDKGKELRYIPTYNGQRAFEQIVKSAPTGVRSFAIVGAYGSGKSTFLWALGETVNSGKQYFEEYDYLLKGFSNNAILDFVGDYSSVIEAFEKRLKYKREEVLTKLSNYANQLQKEGTALIIRIDEFGKFLEFSAKNNPEEELYFLQQLAELVNDSSRNIVLITTLHQDFAAYSYRLSEGQRNEWTKVKGRFKEITFNEPAEQLLLLASERLKEVNFPVKKETLNKVLTAIETANAFPLKDYFSIEIAEKLAPIEILAGSALTIALQRYGQNERSFFSFIESHDYNGLHYYLREPNTPLYNLANVYDYLIYHYFNQLTASTCPDHRAWRLMRDNIEKAEGLFDEVLTEAIQVIKVVGLMNLLGKSSAHINKTFLIAYCRHALGHNETEEVLRLLEQYKVIRFREHSQRYILFAGTDVDIEYAIDEAGTLIGQINNVGQYLKSYFTLPVLPAKRYQIETGTPRFFQLRISDEPINEQPVGETDGFVNLIFSSKLKEEDVRLHSESCEEPILFAYFRNIERLREQITLIERVKHARTNHSDDSVALQEFDSILTHHENLIRYYVLDKFYTAASEDICFFFRGEEIDTIHNRRTLNNYLSHIASVIYDQAPCFLNEMVNKTKLSTPISTARKNLTKNIIEHANLMDLGYESHLFPPDKTIYLSLLKAKGFHRLVDEQWTLTYPTDESFQGVWNCYLAFLDNAKHAKRSLQDLVDELLKRPYKLKKGLVDILLPVFLLIKKDELALYYQNDRFIPDLSADTIDLIIKKPSDYSIKTFSVEGIRLNVFNHYRELLNQAEANKISNKGFIDTIIPFLNFYKELPEFAKKTGKITKEAQRLREAIVKATDPEKSFFEDFPQALGYSIAELNDDPEKLKTYFELLRGSIKEIQLSYDALLERYELFIQQEIIDEKLEFEQWRVLLQKRFKTIKTYVVAPHLKTFLQRISSPLDDKRAWLSSVAQVVVGKSLEQIQDSEEQVLYTKFKEWVHELDNYIDIEKETKGKNITDAIRIEMTDIGGGVQSRVVKVPKSKLSEGRSLEKNIVDSLTDDKNLNIFILTKMLKEQFK